MKKLTKEYSLSFLNPKLSEEWDYEKNYPLKPSDVFLRGRKIVWWICKRGHQWKAAIKTRAHGHGCPYCSKTNKKVCKDNCLNTVNPCLASEWHPTKNGKLTSNDVTPHVNTKVWWICKNKHSYLSSVSNRSSGDGCPYCSGHKVCKDNCLSNANPTLSKEWHPTKNGKLTPNNVTLCSGKKVWWKCRKGHEWKTAISDRKNGCGCPICNKIEMKDGSICDSLTEAYYYLKLKDKKINFIHHVSIGLGKCICDFYIPSNNKYIEVTGFHKNASGYCGRTWPIYYGKIIKKKNHIINVLNAKFKFVQMQLTKQQIQYVRINSI